MPCSGCSAVQWSESHEKQILCSVHEILLVENHGGHHYRNIVK